MASSTVHQKFICHFCFDEFRNRSSLLSHFSYCHMNISSKRNTEPNSNLPRLNKKDHDLLHMLKLHRFNDKLISYKQKDKTNSFLQMPLSCRYISYSKQSSFDDSTCNTNNSLLNNNNNNNNNQFEEKILYNTINTKSSSYYHTYKYSRREQKNFYASVKRARLKKQYTIIKKSHTNSLIFNKENFSINLPTKINSRQQLNTNANNSYPLIFDPNFHTLVKLSTNNLFQNYFSNINIYFHLINSIASQEFQIIINSNDNQQHISYTAYSFINILRQTMADYSLNLQKNFKRNYFQTFQHNDQQIIIPFKIPRYDQTISSSSNIQIDNNDHNLETQIDNSVSSIPINNNNFIQIENNEMNNSIVHPVQSDSILIDHQQSRDRTSTQSIQTSFIPIIEEQKTNRSSSPIFLKKQKIEPIQNDQSNFPIERPRIRIINGSNDNRKQSSSGKKIYKSNNQVDENSTIKPIRMSTRKNSIKTEIITEMNPSFETKPIILSSNEISKEWLTHNVFYRCHACSHEEFFVVLSRECINLHVSSKHGNMEENFKQRLSNFLNNRGRSLKIFQHYLKWQQPWSEKQIEQIFKLSNK
ncbi:unnamed protein product [Rotaria sordida]|uniref:C2H2-type domain-containing protein n=1 Tax=Rotaria sordida TaxID=392033 RepID=A0A814QXP8_9BILA|nr:unnamed protein product [Rotaria sordida]CAF3802375.1 unnamed protein product [Rotaria sordida]